MFKKVAFTYYPVADVARARKFYEETLGLKSGSAGNQGDNWWVEYDLPGGGCFRLRRTFCGNMPKKRQKSRSQSDSLLSKYVARAAVVVQSRTVSGFLLAQVSWDHCRPGRHMGRVSTRAQRWTAVLALWRVCPKINPLDSLSAVAARERARMSCERQITLKHGAPTLA